ncbi:MAG TPA: hypothetical protein ENH19_03335 [Actinobacteria bacterium]|nr:hypothetical protein [Actinomycetes bacterium]HEX21668.1 hypothetical protein [Actinomycetota bacterium]
MRDKIDKLFAKLERLPKPDGLDAEIVTAAFNRPYRQLKYATYSGIIISLAFVIWSVNIFITQFDQSSALNFLKMFFSDFGAVRGNLADWSIALMESLSLDSLLLALLGIFILVILINKLIGLSKQDNSRQPHRLGRVSQEMLN